MKVLIAGGGIGGSATALALHQAGIEMEIFEQVREFRELGVGINFASACGQGVAPTWTYGRARSAGTTTSVVRPPRLSSMPIERELRGRD
jgi:flavin-dependent dehydrogenase